MNSKDYWIKRKAQRMVHDMDQAEKAAKQFDEIYSLASRQITSKIDQIFESYRRDHGLTEDEARRILGNVPNLTDIRGLKLSLQNATDSEEIRQLLTLLDSAPYASRIARYEALQQQVDKISTRLYKAENGASRAFYDKFIPEAYYHSIFDLQQQAGVAFAFNKIDPEEIRKIQQQPWLGANYSQRIWGNTQLLAAELQKELAVSLLTGRSAHETADFIEAQFGKGKNNARRLVRTETAYFHAEMEAKAYEEAEVDKYMFLATLDLRTSGICREHDGEVYEVSERRTGVNYPPMHPWCRSDTIALDDDEWLAKATRSARDPETGKAIQVPADMTYNDWYEKYVEKISDKMYNQHVETPQSIARNMLSDLSKVEPQITRTLDSIAKSSHGHLEGLDFRLKSEESLIRKIETDALLDGISIQEAAKRINDGLRYTTVFDPRNFGVRYGEMKIKLINAGFEVKKVKNTWLDTGPYKGVNTILEKDGIAFEMQYHTKESFDLKNGKLHELYEERRLSTTSQKRKFELDEEMVRLSKNLTVPNGIEGVKNK